MVPKLKRSPQITILSTGLALIAFAANSVFCRMALGEKAIDAASFTAIRLLSGAFILFLLVRLTAQDKTAPAMGSKWAPIMLFLYAMAFSVAYLTLDTATGALILFGSVQITMILYSQWRGERLNRIEWGGVLLACFGFVYLVFPHLTRPSILGFGLMTLAGVGWGSYSLIGRGSTNPLVDTSSNFIRTWPLVLLCLLFAFSHIQLSPRGVVLALLSGTLASGAGYCVWYFALGGLSSTQAAVAQLLVPVIAAFGGIFLVGETLDQRLVFAGLLILGGIAMVFLAKPMMRRQGPQ